MPAKRIAGMARSYGYLQADKRNCPPVCCATARRLDDGGPPTKHPKTVARMQSGGNSGCTSSPRIASGHRLDARSK